MDKPMSPSFLQLLISARKNKIFMGLTQFSESLIQRHFAVLIQKP